jgi:hypothetical protein
MVNFLGVNVNFSSWGRRWAIGSWTRSTLGFLKMLQEHSFATFRGCRARTKKLLLVSGIGEGLSIVLQGKKTDLRDFGRNYL